MIVAILVGLAACVIVTLGWVNHRMAQWFQDLADRENDLR